MVELIFLMELIWENGSATAVLWNIFSMDHHGEHVNQMVPGVEVNLLVKVR